MEEDTPVIGTEEGVVEGEAVITGDEAAAHEEIGGEGHEEVEGEQLEGEGIENEDKENIIGEGEEVMGEEEEKGEKKEGEEEEGEKKEEEKPPEEQVEEEEGYVEEPPPDPAAPFEFSDSKEALKEPFQLRLDQLAEVEQLWELYQNYTPAYTDIKGHITEKELVYMLKCLLLMTHTPEQLQELIAFCVRPPHPEGHISFEQFVKMVTIRQRDFNVEDELRAAMRVLDPDMTGAVDRAYLREVLSKQGHKMPQKLLDNLIKEVDMSNDGTIGIDDVVGTMGIDLNKEDLVMLMAAIYPDGQPQADEEA
ncbi:cilia- and flagella-associated protein 251 [Manduca sexta]|uniref:cilia- and flagella-associated protein 251 n=1 Tax=Manduca sexta TaxID=7130 RepID=UPI00188DEEDF|nr:cilia- and flagella-associated protein 251 [Manduca sexta]